MPMHHSHGVGTDCTDVRSEEITRGRLVFWLDSVEWSRIPTLAHFHKGSPTLESSEYELFTVDIVYKLDLSC